MRRYGMWVAGLCLAGGIAHAQIYRCQEGGKLVFSDRPCGDAAQVIEKARSGGSPSGQVQFDVLTRHYRVEAGSLRGAWLAMRRDNPGGFAGWARWKVEYAFDTRPQPDGCSVERLTLSIVGDILMPQWQQYAQASRDEQAEWDRMYAALKVHEDGHIQHGREFAVLVRERLLGLGTLPCPEIKPRVQAEYDRLYKNLQSRDADYDRRTDHGLRQNNPR